MAQTVGVIARFDTSQFNAGLKSYVNGLTVVTNVTVQTTRDVNNLNTAFNAGLGSAIGTAAISAIQGIARAVRELSGEVVDLISRFELLGFNLRSLIAADFVKTGLAPDLASGLVEAEKVAPALRAQLEQLAILSAGFDSFQVADLLRRTLIGTFELNDALEITQTLLDFSAFQGVPPEQIGNIIREIGQIRIAGKVTGEQLRDLSRNSFDIAGIINRALEGTGKSFEDVRENGSEALKLLFTQLKKEVGGSAEEVAGTFSGLLSSLREIRQISLVNLFSPVGEALKPQLQALVDLFTSPEFKASLTVIGELLGNVISNALNRLVGFVQGAIQAWQNLDPAVKRNIIVFGLAAAGVATLIGVVGALVFAIGTLINPFTLAVVAIAGFVTALADGFQGAERITATLVNTIAKYFNELVDAAVDWGVGIGQSLADGFVQAANVVVSAVNVIGQAISYLMAPGSPPRFLPDIDKWGTETAEVYLQGWTQADFSILDQVGSSIRSILQNLVAADQLNKVDVPRLVLGSRQAFAQAIADVRAFGKITETTIQQIQQQAGPAADVVTEFARRYADVAVSTDAVTQAQNELNRITQQYDAILTPLQRQLREVSDAQQSAQEQVQIAALQRVIANRGVSDARKQAAQLEIQEILTRQQVRNLENQRDAATEQAQAQVDATQEIQSQAQNELQLFQARIQAQTQQTQLQNEYVRLLKEQAEEANKLDTSVGNVGRSLAKALDPLSKQLKLIQLQKAALQDNIREAKARAVLEDSNATAAQKATAELELQEIALRRQQRLLEARELGFSDEDIQKIERIPIVLADIEKSGKGAAEGIKGALDLGGAGIDTGILTQFNAKLEETREKFDNIKQSVIDAATEIDKNLPTFLKLFPEETGGKPPIIQTLEDYKLAILGVGGAFVLSKIIVSVRDLAAAFGLLKLTSAVIVPGIQAIGTAILALNPITLAAAAAIAVVASAYYFNIGGIGDFIDEKVALIGNSFRMLSADADFAFAENGITGVFRYLAEETGKIFSKLGEDLGNFFKSLPARVIGVAVTGEFGEAGTKIGNEIATKLKDAFIAKYTEIKDAITGVIDFVFDGSLLEAAQNKAKELGAAITGGIGDGIKSAQQTANDALSFITFGLLGQAEEDAEIKSPSRLFARQVGKPIGEGIAQGISEADTGSGIFDFITKIITAFATLATSVIASTGLITVPVTTVFTTIGTTVQAATDVMVTNVTVAYQLMSDTINLTTELMALGIVTKFTQLGLDVYTITNQMRLLVLIEYQTMDAEVNAAVVVFAAGVTAKIEELTKAIVALFNGMREGVKAEISGMATETLEALGTNGLLGDILDLAGSYEDAGKVLGRALLKGVERGVRDKDSITSVLKAINSLANKIEDRLKEAFNIQSPSKLTEKEVGEPIVQGIARGMQNQIGAVIAAAQTIAAQTINTLQSATAQITPQTSSFLPGSTSNVSTTNNYNLNVSSQASSQGIVNDFKIMEVLATV